MARVCLALLTFAALLPFCRSPAAPAATISDGVARVPAGRGPSALAAADVNADGLLDLVVGNETEGTLLVVDGRGSCSSPSPYFAGALPYYRVRTGDLDGDGRPDVAIALSREHGVAVLRSDGRGGLTPMPGAPFPAGGNNPLTVAIGDF